MKPKSINQLALWLTMRDKELSIKRFPPGYPYLSKGLIVHSTFAKPVIRYAKNFKTSKKTYSLCFITTQMDIVKAENWLDEQAKKIKEEDIEAKFKLLDVYYA